MKRKFLTVLSLLLVCALVFGACANRPDVPAEPEATATPEPTPDVTAEPTTEPTATPEPTPEHTHAPQPTPEPSFTPIPATPDEASPAE